MTSALFIGTYADAHGEGLVPLIRDPQGGGWVAGVANPGVANASWGVAAAGTGALYFVDERAGTIGAWGTRPAWHALGEVASGGEAPCHLALSPDARRLAIANYESGEVRLVALGEDGAPGAVLGTWRRDGHGPNVERQRGPHAHWVGFSRDGEWLWSTDLGADRILALPIAGDPAAAQPRLAWQAPAGSGPRHIAFHPARPLAYLVSELASTLTTLAVEGATLAARDTRSTLPSGFAGDSLGGAIAIDPAGTRLWVTNRGHDSIATFALDDDGLPRPLGHMPSGGTSPRHLLVVDDTLVCPHEGDGCVAIFTLRDGIPRPDPQRLKIPGAAFAMAAAAT